MESIGDRLAKANWRPSGFDYLRIGLATLIVLQHAEAISIRQDPNLWETPLNGFLFALLPMFFALSGFLVTGSLLRSQTIAKFLGLRIIRIFPALVVEVILSAFLIGPFVTTLSLHDYFTSPIFFKYFLNMIGDVQLFLPETFKGNFIPYVNLQLWTIPFELYCYISIAIFALLGVKKWPIAAPILTVLSITSYMLFHGIRHDWELGLTGGFGAPGIFLVFSFLAGVCFYIYKDKIPWSPALFVASCVLVIIFGEFRDYKYAFWNYLYPFFICYVTVFLGSSNKKRIKLIETADYSYGMYLYHFVILQTLYYFLPITHHYFTMVFAGVPLVVIFAALSWHLIERPALGFRGKLDLWETRLLNIINARKAPKSTASS